MLLYPYPCFLGLLVGLFGFTSGILLIFVACRLRSICTSHSLSLLLILPLFLGTLSFFLTADPLCFCPSLSLSDSVVSGLSSSLFSCIPCAASSVVCLWSGDWRSRRKRRWRQNGSSSERSPPTSGSLQLINYQLSFSVKTGSSTRLYMRDSNYSRDTTHATSKRMLLSCSKLNQATRIKPSFIFIPLIAKKEAMAPKEFAGFCSAAPKLQVAHSPGLFIYFFNWMSRYKLTRRLSGGA